MCTKDSGPFSNRSSHSGLPSPFCRKEQVLVSVGSPTSLSTAKDISSLALSLSGQQVPRRHVEKEVWVCDSSRPASEVGSCVHVDRWPRPGHTSSLLACGVETIRGHWCFVAGDGHFSIVRQEREL